MKDVTTGETLCNGDKPIILVRMDFPEPVISVAVEPKTKDDQEKMGIALGKLAQEDPSFRVKTDEETGQTDRKSTRLNSVTNAQLVCRLLLEKKKTRTDHT